MAFRTKDCPEKPAVWATPGVSRAIFSSAAVTSSVRSSEAESGSWTFATRRPLSWLGTNPLGTRVKPKPVRPIRPT